MDRARELRRRTRIVKTKSILAWMAVAIALVTLLAYWDEERESAAALDDFAQEQSTLSATVAASMREKLNASSETANAEQLLSTSRSIERPHTSRVLLATPAGSDLATTDGARIRSNALEEAVRTHAASVRLSRPEAADLGLGFPSRMAIAGLTGIDAPSGHYTVVVVTSAFVERDREARAKWRLVLGVVLTSGLVIAFGSLAMRKQRKELELAHQLALTTLQTERNEKLVRADKLATMGALATGIAHEVSTPLGVILGRAEQLLPKQTDDRSRRAVEIITAQTERIHAVIRGFLALARGKEPALEHCAPAALAKAAMELVLHRFEKAGVRLESDIASSLPNVPCDPRLFEQVLVNLLLNACDACDACEKEDGLVSLRVSLEKESVYFVVTDNGIGISPGDAERVTEPFFTTKDEDKGTGLGLAIATEIVKHHCGSLTLRPRGVGRRGTIASVDLPAVVTTPPIVKKEREMSDA